MTLEKNIPEIDGLNGTEEYEKVDKSSLLSVKTFVISFGTIILVGFFILMTRNYSSSKDYEENERTSGLGNKHVRKDFKELVYVINSGSIGTIDLSRKNPEYMGICDSTQIDHFDEDDDYIYFQYQSSATIKRLEKKSKIVSDINFNYIILKNDFCLRRQNSITTGIFIYQAQYNTLRFLLFDDNQIYPFYNSKCSKYERPSPILQSNNGNILLYKCLNDWGYVEETIFLFTLGTDELLCKACEDDLIVLTPDDEWVLQFIPSSNRLDAYQIGDKSRATIFLDFKISNKMNVSFSKNGEYLYIFPWELNESSKFEMITIDYKKLIYQFINLTESVIYVKSIKEIEMSKRVE